MSSILCAFQVHNEWISILVLCHFHDEEFGPRPEQESLLIFNGVERPAGSGDTGTSSSDQGMETGWPRIFHCDLGEEAELPLLAEPRLGAEQVCTRGILSGFSPNAVDMIGEM